MILDKMCFIKALLDEDGVEYDTLKIRHIYCNTWYNWRNEFKALRITKSGLDWLKQHTKFYKIAYSTEVNQPFTNKVLMLLSKHIDCPFYLDEDAIWVSTEQVAVQLILFNGNIEKYCLLKEKHHQAALTSTENSVL
jgi:uncharacterized HAD superfamily protein